MPFVSDVLTFILRFRLDAITVATVVLIACAVCRTRVRRHGAAQELSDLTCMTVAVLAIAGALLAEWTTLVLGQPGVTPLTTIMLARAAVLGAATLVSAVLLTSAARLALLRAELRVHADAGRQLQQAKLQADEANRAKSDFLAVMSHEIRTPLNAVMGFANLLAETRLDDAQRGYVSTITTEGARLGAIINDILDLTKIEKGRLILERLPFAPAETVQEVLRLLNPRAAEKKIELRFEAQVAGALLVGGDPLRFRQILVNLVDNAIKFTTTGSVTVFMAWKAPDATGQPGLLSMRVRDTGIGIPADKVKDLFQMFMQADTSTTRRYGGTGLGLAICQRLVMLMGGKIIVDSTPGQGSEFSFSLPLTTFAMPVEPPAPETPAAEVRAPAPPRVLVVDDLETNQFLMRVFLQRNGFDPQIAASGEEAVRLAAAERFDAILMDLQMPGIDGYTATQRIRAAETEERRTPIIALTASIARGTREKCLAAGMDEYLAKPLDLRKFRALLTTLTRSPSDPRPLSS